MDVDIPSLQWAMTCPEQGKLQLKQIPVPIPKNGEVLIKVLAAPINPSDLFMMKGLYVDFDLFKIPYPNSAGWEGSGIVVKEGAGLMTRGAKGKRVSFVRNVVNTNEMLDGGCYQQYCIAAALSLNYIPESLPIEVASMHFVNPLTALGLYEKVVSLKAATAIQTGAAS
jgi:NADPH2:quinone reductase